MSAWCNSVNKSNLQFSGHSFIYKQSVGDLTVAQFLKHTIIPRKQQVFHYKYSKTLLGGFRTKRNRSNTGARPDRKVRFILGELFDTWRRQPNGRKWFWLDGIESCCVGVEGSGDKHLCQAFLSPGSLLQLSLFFASIFPQETPDTQARGCKSYFTDYNRKTHQKDFRIFSKIILKKNMIARLQNSAFY